MDPEPTPKAKTIIISIYTISILILCLCVYGLVVTPSSENVNSPKYNITKHININQNKTKQNINLMLICFAANMLSSSYDYYNLSIYIESNITYAVDSFINELTCNYNFNISENKYITYCSHQRLVCDISGNNNVAIVFNQYMQNNAYLFIDVQGTAWSNEASVQLVLILVTLTFIIVIMLAAYFPAKHIVKNWRKYQTLN